LQFNEERILVLNGAQEHLYIGFSLNTKKTLLLLKRSHFELHASVLAIPFKPLFLALE
jgi:hypothetical protein